MYPDESILKSANKSQAHSAPEPCGSAVNVREMTVREMLRQKADNLRAEALQLELLATQYREGCMHPDVEATLARLVSGGLYR